MTNKSTDIQVVKNPFGEVVQKESNALAEVESQRAIQEVQAAITVAKKFPRNEMVATDRILRACTRKSLAEGALYSYNKGKTDVSGPSIRLAETIAQNWGNFQYGIRELSQQTGSSTVEAFAWDLETNVRSNKVFQVPHIQYSKNYGNKVLTDPRDIYEKVANDGARRLRACILAVIPSDVTESAAQQCEDTLKANADTSPAAIKKLCESFKAFKVTEEMLQKRIGNRLDAIRPAQIVQLRKIYASLKDGMGKASDWFGEETSVVSAIDNLNKQLEKPEPNEPHVPPEIVAKAEELFNKDAK